MIISVWNQRRSVVAVFSLCFFLFRLSFFAVVGDSFVLPNAAQKHTNKMPPRSADDCNGNSSENRHDIPSLSSPSSKKFTMGVIADIQYAPIPDGTSYTGTPRFYRHALKVAKHAFQHFEEEQVDLVVNLGDTIDGKCQDIAIHGGNPIPEGEDPGHYSLNHVMEAVSAYKGRVLHTYGNHCLYNLHRRDLQDRLGIQFTEEPCGDLVGYYDYVHDNIRFVVLDAYDVAIMQRCEISSQKRKQATEILQKNNPNFAANMNSPEGLNGNERRFVGFNGGVGPLQLQWLRKTLIEARQQCQKVVILSHNPILPESSSPVCLIWNYDQVLSVLRENSDVVVASLCGHAHKGGYYRDLSGIHFRVVEAVLENRPERTYAMVDVYEDRLVVRGYGNCESAEYDFSHCCKEVVSSIV